MPPEMTGSSLDAIIACYAQDVDLTAVRQNLRLTTQQRSEKFDQAMKLVFELRRHAASRQRNSTQHD